MQAVHVHAACYANDDGAMTGRDPAAMQFSSLIIWRVPLYDYDA